MRSFVAVWPDDSTRVALAALSDRIRHSVKHRRATRIDNLHLTLAFIGDLADDDAFAVADAAAKLRFQPFVWQLDTLGSFAEAGVVWAGADTAKESPAALLALARQLRGTLDRLSVEYDRRPFAPHVTLLRGVRRFEPQPIAPPIHWRVDSIALYRSAGGRYSRVLG